MGKTLPLNEYLQRIKHPDNVTLLEPFKGCNTNIKYFFTTCGCEIFSNIRQVSLFKDFDTCRKCRPRFPLKHFLDKVDFDVELLEPYTGGYTKCKVLKKCGHEDEFILHRINHTNIESCKGCSVKNPLQHYLDILPEHIANSVEVIGDYGGQKSIVKVTYECGHSGQVTLGHLINDIKSFEFCIECVLRKTEKNLIEKVPEEYRELITFTNKKGFYSEILYKNPCGHESKTILGSFYKRKQFDHCISCYNYSTKLKSSDDYIKNLPENLKIQVTEENGRFSYVKFTCLTCNNESEIRLHSLLKTKGTSCRKCDMPNKHSEDDMKMILSEFMDVDRFSDRGSHYTSSRNTIVHGYCKNCNAYLKKNFFALSQYYKVYQKAQCSNCAPKNITQKSIYDFVKNLESNIILDCRNQIKVDTDRFKEIDIYCPDKRLGIEYNGLIWHSERYKDDKRYHLKKSKACAEKGITLLQIWGDKYMKNPDIYHSIIKTKLGKIENNISARKTKVKELSKKELKKFLNKNHIDGHIGCITGWGLFHNNKLVQAISVRKVSSKNKKYGGYLEVARLCTLTDHFVTRGDSKLLSVVEKFARDQSYKGILSYVSSDFGRIPKKKWKFTFDGYTTVSYFYTDGTKGISRQSLQKRQKGISEKEYAESLSLYRVNANDSLIYSLKF